MTVGLCACDLFGDSSGSGSSGGQQGVSYGTATVNYYYDYSFGSYYWQEKYSIVSGTTYELKITYTPPMKAGYRFLGWTTEYGGEGDLIGDTYNIKGAGFGGTIYNFYAKFEEIPFEVVYHLDGGVNHPDNPTSLSGKQKLQKPTKEKHNFIGWYREPDFQHYTDYASMIDDHTTTVDLYARWERVYTVSYLSNQEKIKVKGDKSTRPVTSFTADYQEFTIRLTPEYFKGYHFLGWEIEGEDELVQSIEIPVDPKTVTDDLTYTAHYLEASNRINTPGLRVMNAYGVQIYYARKDVTQIVIEDKYGSKYSETVTSVVIYYSGDTPPEVIGREDMRVTLSCEPNTVEEYFTKWG